MANKPAPDLPTYAEASRRINAWLAHTGQEWAGIPMPIPDLKLTIEPKNPWKAKIEAVEAACHDEETAGLRKKSDRRFICNADDGDWLVKNTWWSERLRRHVGIAASLTPPVRYRAIYLEAHDYVRRFDFLIDTMRASTAWTVDTEMTAIEKLGDLIPVHLWDAYVTTGAFLESSKRSGLTYVFRRCRPTIAFNSHSQKIVACLCLHPIGYYEDSYAGSMCPTDDVLAHLMLMRGDEAMFWRRANQHQPEHPEAGL